MLEEGNRVKGLVVSAGGDVAFHDRQLRQSGDVAFQPMDITLLGSQRFVLSLNDFPCPPNSFDLTIGAVICLENAAAIGYFWRYQLARGIGTTGMTNKR